MAPLSSLPSTKPTRGLFGRLINHIEQRRASDRALLRILFFVFLGSSLLYAISVSTERAEPTPVAGGTLVEGIVGIPRFVNPVLAVTRADQDMTALLFRGLMKIDTDGQLVPDVASSITPSSDGLTYNVIVRDNIRFHDNTPLTARDVIFTIGLMQDADLKSPQRGNWVGITIEEINEYEFNIVLNEAYTPFIENLTFGILPRHIWSELPIEQIPFSQRNTDPVGNGPFKVETIVRNQAGIIQSYRLSRFVEADETANIAAVDVRFYDTEEALVRGYEKNEFSSTVYAPLHSLSQIASQSNTQIVTEPLPRVFALFFNQNRSPLLRDISARRALDAAIDRTAVVDSVLSGYGVPITTPIPPTQSALQSKDETSTGSSTSIATAADILVAGGWRQNESGQWQKSLGGDTVTLSVTIKTATNATLQQTSEAVAAMWRQLGVEVFIEQYEQSDLLQVVIRPRDFEVLLFGIDMNRSVDLYPFWHSSQRDDPGLNLAQYANIEVDTLLEKARSNQIPEERADALSRAVGIISKEYPAAFLFTPTLTYVTTDSLTPVSIRQISRPHERFMNIADWYITTENRWSIFR